MANNFFDMAAFSACGNYLLCAASTPNATVKVFSARMFDQFRPLFNFDEPANLVAISSDSNYIAYTNQDGIRICARTSALLKLSTILLDSKRKSTEPESSSPEKKRKE